LIIHIFSLAFLIEQYNSFSPLNQGVLKVKLGCHCEPFFGEAIPVSGQEIASPCKERRVRNDIESELRDFADTLFQPIDFTKI
jgi:hypothetical protein